MDVVVVAVVATKVVVGWLFEVILVEVGIM